MYSGIRSIHFSGVCGTAMASVAVALQDRGFQVTGSDENAYPPMSTFLADRGIEVQSGYGADNLRHQPDLVVIGNALSRGNPEIEHVLDTKLRYTSLPELLREFFLRGKRCVVVAGTHGKTTTAALMTWVLEHQGLNPGYLIGGLPNNLGQGCRLSEGEWFVLEGDEYDTAFFDKRSKFVHYLPEIVILNNLEFDHADIFPDLAAIQRSFSHLIRLVPRGGLLLANGDDPNLTPLLEHPPCPVLRFGLGHGNEVRATEVDYGSRVTGFQVGEDRFEIPLAGEFNLRNALGVVAAAKHVGFAASRIQSALAAFQGVKRRMEIRGEERGVTVIDDFGHHPSAIRETLLALRRRYTGARVWALFEPRSNTTRRNIFQAALAEALGEAHRVMVARIARPERLAPEERLDPDRLIEDLKRGGVEAGYEPDLEAMVAHVAESAQAGDVVCCFSNGGFGGIHERLLARLR